LLLLNVDRFKEVNNIQSLHFNDLVLLAFSRRLSATIPENVILARIGGDEFGLLLPELGDFVADSKTQLIKIIEKILADSLKHYEVMGDELFLEVSIGPAVFNNASGSDADLLKFADLALEEAKTSGRNRYTFIRTDFADERGVT